MLTPPVQKRTKAESPGETTEGAEPRPPGNRTHKSVFEHVTAARVQIQTNMQAEICAFKLTGSSDTVMNQLAWLRGGGNPDWPPLLLL